MKQNPPIKSTVFDEQAFNVDCLKKDFGNVCVYVFLHFSLASSIYIYVSEVHMNEM